MNSKIKAKKASSRTPHAAHKVRASGRWADAQRPHRTPTHASAPPAESPKEQPDSEMI